MALILDGTNGLSDVDGSAATPAIRGSDANTGVFFGTDIVGVSTSGTERVRVDASGNVGIGTSSPGRRLVVSGVATSSASGGNIIQSNDTSGSTSFVRMYADAAGGNVINWDSTTALRFATATEGFGSFTERARIDSSGNLLVGTTSAAPGSANTDVGCALAGATGIVYGSRASGASGIFNTNTDGQVIRIHGAGTLEGNISVSGTTVSYNGGHLSRWAQTTTAKDESLVKGTVLSNLDEMNVYTDAEGNPVENEQLNKVKVSDVEGDANVAGVFVNWEHDEQHNVDEINMAMTGDMIIRIAAGTTVQRGDLLMSAGDGTAKPQGDDIVRSKTIAKVTSTHVTCTYADGSFCVPCVLMAC
jgi:hypothetical protein